MPKLEWDKEGQKRYELGISKVVLFKYAEATKKWLGTAWNGVISVNESPDGADETELWADNIKYGGLRAAEKFSGSLEAYMSPPEFDECDGQATPIKGVSIGQQKRVKFGLCYRTEIGNDMNSEAGYTIHLVYNATCSPSEQDHETVNDSPDAQTMSWDFDTTPVNVTGYKATSHIKIDSTQFTTEAEKAKLKQLEDALYGTESSESELLMPDDVLKMLGNVA